MEDKAEKSGILMDTFVSIHFWGKDSKKAEEICWQKLEELNQKLDRFNPESEIYKINEKAGEWVKISEEVEDILRKAKYYAKISDGLFDPTIAPLMKLWGFYNGKLYLPTEREIKKVLEKVDWRKLEILKGKVRLKEKGMALDLGGIAKGYAVQKLLEICKGFNLKRIYLDIGGTIGVYGKPLKGDYWVIGIRHPRQEGKIIGEIKIKKGVVATSGDYERFFVKDNKRYPHIINPKTGYPSTEVMSVSVFSEDGTEADALSTVFFILGKNWQEFYKKFKNIEVFMIDSEGRISKSKDTLFEER